MSTHSLLQRTAQLDEAERSHLEDVVVEMRDRVEDNVRFQLTQNGLDDEPEETDALDDDTEELVEAIELELVDGNTWDEAFEQYVDGVGYTIVNRLAALRCMEVRDFVDEDVTVFEETGLTPAAETLVREEFLLEDEAVLAAYHNACDELAEEIEILFDRSSVYSLVDPNDEAFEALCAMLDEVPDQIWRADDVLGWVYEYYNRPVVEALDAKNALEPGDVGPANRFYTPHWVVRMLADNSLGKLYLEATGREDAVPEPETLAPAERKERSVTPDSAPNIPELCTYLIPDEDDQDAPDFDHPSDLRVIDPACGSGHFLLYAFDILERIWWEETDIDRSEIPAKILKQNLYGVDIDFRSCQLSAFNLYLKARVRAEAEGNAAFDMPNLGIVCADARVAEVEEAADVLDRITGERTRVREALDDVIDEFQTTEALGGLLDVRGALAEEFAEKQTGVTDRGGEEPHTLNEFLRTLEEAVEKRTSDSFGERNLRSFLNLLVVLTQEYDVALMNPPYGSGGRMPDDVQKYVGENYDYTTEYYINFFETCDRLAKTNGRVGMLVPRSFMFMDSFETFREDFIGDRGSFDFLAEFGLDILDNAVVRTAGTVVRSGVEGTQEGTFLRLDDVEKGRKEESFLHSAFVDDVEDGVERKYVRNLTEFDAIPGKNLSYWVPQSLRKLYDSDTVLDAEKERIDGKTMGSVKVGLQTGNNQRFVRNFWEHKNPHLWKPFAKGGSDAWMLPRMKLSVLWGEDGAEVKRYGKSYPRNAEQYFTEGLTYTVAKTSGRRFGYLHDSSVFGTKGSAFLPEREIWAALSYTNSHLFTYLMIAQTVERNWKRRQVARIPWHERLEQSDTLTEVSREAVGKIVSKRQYDLVSPHYAGPVLLAVMGKNRALQTHVNHPHRELREDLDLIEPAEIEPESASLNDLGVAAARHLERIEAELQSCADAIDEAVFDCFDITSDQQESILQEIALRTSRDPREREECAPEEITEPTEPTEQFPGMVKDLLLHLAMRVVHEDDDGIVPISEVDSENGLLERIEDEFDRIFGEHADARLAEVDRILGSKSAGEEAYPNLRTWLEDGLFDYHVSTFDRTPILWRLTTERLVSDPEGEGFGCLVDYHQLDGSVLDRLQTRYLEPRKALLRERRTAADRRRGDSSRSASEQAEAAEEYAHCESGLEQIDVFEDRLADLAQPEPRDWSVGDRELAESAVEHVSDFRERTASRLEAVETLAELDDVDMDELFSPSFHETVKKNREEWLDALHDLERAFEAYSKEGSEPVKAEHYDLFEYYDDLIGSAHYSSNGILFMTYYFGTLDGAEQPQTGDDGQSQISDAGQSQIGDGSVSERQRLLSELASGLDEYEERATEIAEACDEIARDESPDWSERALSEITTAGYQPNRKHGVVINITPLVEAEIVPETVDKQVI